MPPPPCGNPLFLSWLTEFHDTLRAADARSTQTYKNACDSLRACPVTYARPAELVHLRGIGPTIIKQLERRQREWCKEQGVEVPQGPQGPVAVGGPAPAAGPSRKRKTTAGSGPRGRVAREAREWSTDSDDSDVPPAAARAAPPKIPRSTAPASASAPTSKLKAKGPKLYVPRARSGAYAILLALLLRLPLSAHAPPPPDTEDTTNLRDGWASKADLVDDAQGWCDVSMTQGEKGGYHNGWSAMAGLTQKGLVYRESNPARFRLTELGLETARAIYRLARPPAPVGGDAIVAKPIKKTKDDHGTVAPAAFPAGFSPPPECRAGAAVDIAIADSDDSEAGGADGSARGLFAGFGFHYLNTAGARVTTRYRAAPRLDPTTHRTLRRIEFAHRLMTHAAVQRLVGVERLEERPGTCRGWIDEADAPDAPPGEAPRDGEAGTHKHPRFTSHMPARVPDVEYGRDPEASVCDSEDDDAVDGADEAGPPAVDPADFDLASAVPFPAGSYEIILIMDCREIRKKRDVDAMTQGLLDKGVKVELRALQIGDVAWVARDVSGARKGEDAECVLDFVVERKRLDDLVQSIKDGRYEDQKLRLTNSCIRNVYYIIEDWDAQRNKAESGQAIATSKSQTQIVDGFFLRDTYSLKETIAFLKTMHDTINELYEFETLHLIPSKFITRPKYAELQKRLRDRYPTKYFGTSFETYQAINSKSANNTLLETFARMLMCVRGMSSEKVALILDVWQTPRAMWDDLKRREKEIADELAEEKAGGAASRGKSKVRPIDVFFADAVEGRTARQKIGDALSRELYAVLTAE